MDAIEFVETSEFVVGTIDEARVTFDIGTSLELRVKRKSYKYVMKLFHRHF